MDSVPGAATFQTSGAAYDLFMGRYSRPLAAVFADSVGIAKGGSALDVGCGPGALTQVLVDRLVRPGGTVTACVWDFGRGMQMLRLLKLRFVTADSLHGERIS